MPRNLRRAIGVAASTLLAGFALAPSAQADIMTFPDVGGHITSVRVSHGPATVGVTANDAEMEFTTRYEFWLDTNPNDPGAEYRVDVIPNSEVLPLMKVANFDSPHQDQVRWPAGPGGRGQRRRSVRQDHRAAQLHGDAEQGSCLGSGVL